MYQHEGEEPLLRVAVEELARRGSTPDAAEGGTGAETDAGGRKRMFMAGRVGPDASRIHYDEAASPPVEGPWDLALVVRPR